jgi:hypothetical protein
VGNEARVGNETSGRDSGAVRLKINYLRRLGDKPSDITLCPTACLTAVSRQT